MARQRANSKRAASTHSTPALAAFVTRELLMRFRFKNRMYIALVRRDGSIIFDPGTAEWSRFKGKVYRSPSAAGSAVAGNAVNGWRDWRYRNAEGKWVRLGELRRTKR